MAICLAHGAGAPMDSPFMTTIAEGLAAAGIRVARFEFPYMVARRDDGRKRPPDRAAVLIDCWQRVIEALGPERLVIGGKSMGGRMASLVAAERERCGAPVRGLVCFGFPFHAPGKPPAERIAPLAALKTPTLICQGSRDPFGTEAEVAKYKLAKAIRLHWLADGNHDLAPRKASGRTAAQNLAEAVAAAAAFVKEL